MVPRSSLIRWAAAALYRAGLDRPLRWGADRARRTPGFPILAYHRVNDRRDPFFPAVPTDVFERHMAHISRAYRVLTVEDLVRRMRDGRVPRDALAITFDDGYRDNLTHAAPILAHHGLPATIFLTTGFIGTAEVPWVDRLALAFKTSTRSTLELPGGESLSLATETNRLAALARANRHLKSLRDDDLRRSLDVLLETMGVTGWTELKDLMLSWDDVHALTGLGFSVGAHTIHHPILSRVSRERAWTEILGSRTMIESACNRVPEAFAYPNGQPTDYTETVSRLVRQAGFTCAVTTRFGVNTARTPRWELRRGQPWEPDVATFAMKLAWYRLVLR